MVKRRRKFELLRYNYKHLTLLLLLEVFVPNCPVIFFDIDELGHHSYSSIFINSTLCTKAGFQQIWPFVSSWFYLAWVKLSNLPCLLHRRDLVWEAISCTYMEGG